MGRHFVPITSNDIDLYGQCKICKVLFYKDNINRAHLIQNYNKHINSKKHNSLFNNNNIEDKSENKLNDLVKRIEVLVEVLEKGGHKINL